MSGVTAGAVIVGVGTHIYDNRSPEKLLQHWDTRRLLVWVARLLKFSDVVSKNGTLVDPNDENCWILSEHQILEKGTYRDPKVLNLYNALFELFTTLLERDEIKRLYFRKSVDGDDSEINRKWCVINSFADFLASVTQKEGKWKLNTKCYFDTGAPVLQCDIPDTTGDQTYEYKARVFNGFSDENCNNAKTVIYKATFKKLNGKLTFEKVEFEN